MKLYRTKNGNFISLEGSYYKIEDSSWDQLIARDDLYDYCLSITQKGLTSDRFAESELLPPVENQEVWASGVTYYRSRTARMEESKEAGGGSFYDRVYSADRPELFFKAAPYRVVGPGANVRIRKDSKWNVPEPELTLFICSGGTIEGYTCGNDMSSRDIEGENPLYLPQAKSYNGSAAIGPCLYINDSPIHPDSMIHIEIIRNKEKTFSGEISINRMKRKHTELAEYLF